MVPSVYMSALNALWKGSASEIGVVNIGYYLVVCRGEHAVE